MPAHLSQVSWQCPLLVAKLSLSWVLGMAQTVETVRLGGWEPGVSPVCPAWVLGPS